MTDPDSADDEPGTGTPIPYSHNAVFQLEIDCTRDLEGFLRRQLGNDPDLIRVMEDVWGKLIEKWERQGVLINPERLLFQLARNRAIDRIRQRARRPENSVADIGSIEETPDVLATNTDFIASLPDRLDVRAALAELPVRQQQALLFVKGYRLTYRQAGHLMMCPAHTVGHLLNLAKAGMKRSAHLTGYGPTSPSSPPEVHSDQ